MALKKFGLLDRFSWPSFIRDIKVSGFSSGLVPPQPQPPPPSAPVTSVTVFDTKSYGKIAFGAPSYTVPEDQGQVTIELLRLFGTKGVLNVDYKTVDGSAKAGVDYKAISGRLTWNYYDSSTKRITIPIFKRPEVVSDSFFNISLSGTILDLVGGGSTPFGSVTFPTVVGNVEFHGPSSATITITRSRLGQLRFAATVPIEVVDPGSGQTSVDVWIERLTSTKGAMSVDYETIGQTAEAGVDYVAQSGSLQWADGDGVPKKVTVPIIGRAGNQGTRSLLLRAFNVRGGTWASGASEESRTIIIKDTGSGSSPTPGPRPETWVDLGIYAKRGEQILDLRQIIAAGEEVILLNFARQLLGGRVGWGAAQSSYGGSPDFTASQPLGASGKGTVEARLIM